MWTKISALPADTNISDDDVIYKVDDASGTPLSRKITWANVKAVLKTYFDTLYQAVWSYATLTWAETLTNKRINIRVNTITTNATPTPAWDTTDEFTVTALEEAAEFAAPTWTPTDWQLLLIRIKDDWNAWGLTWNAIYRASTDLELPTTTIVSKTLYLQFVYNTTDSKWDLLGLLDNF